MTALSIQQVTARVRDLPPLPAVVVQIIESLGHDDLSADDLAAKISQDQALTAKTLRLANSSFYGMTREIGSIHEAITILGMRTVRTVVTAAGITGSIPRQAGSGLDFDAFWRHSIGTALCAQALARELRMEPDIAFTVGLLHDIGRLALASCFAADYAQVLQHQRDRDSLPTEAEQDTLGFTHAMVGGAIAE
ncbi:MAG: HDOD domain-containing protein, partial [Rubrivivax sp.]